MLGLMQIAEPGMSEEVETRLAVGIDLGTTNSLVATFVNGTTEVIRDGKGRALFPSIVRYLPDGSVETGYEAQEKLATDSKNTVSSAKRLIGRDLADIGHGLHLPYNFHESAGVIRIDTVAGEKTPVEVSAEILKVLRARAEERLGGDLVGAVITVPAYFDDAQRQATKDAAKIAGLNVLRLLNEPTAAALAYGLDNGAEGLYLIYDLGGGTFDVSLLKLSRGVFEVVATGGDSALGGDDFDLAVCSHVLASEGIAYEMLSGEEKRAALIEARTKREALTEAETVAYSLTLSNGRTIEQTITRSQFATLAKPLIDKTIETVKAVLADAKAGMDAIQGIVLVGGSTRMPAVREAIQTAFGVTPLTDIDPDQVVAVGAALQANKLAGNAFSGDDWLLLDVTPLSLGIETMGGLVEKIIPRNTPVPVAMAQDFTTFKDNQTALAVHVVQGEREIVDACRSLARFVLRGIPPMAAGAARIRVTYQIDADGLLSVSAREMQTGAESSIQVKPSYGLSDDEIVRMLKDGTGAAEKDAAERKLREECVESKRLIEATNSALAADSDLLSEEELKTIQDGISTLENLLEKTDSEAIKAAREALVALTGEFAARRMDRSIQMALSGQSIDAI